MGVNQGGVLSPFLFRKYLQDLCQYFENKDGIKLGVEILMYLLWADDLVMLAETADGLQRQIDRLAKYCHRNQFIINILKTKIVILSKKSAPSEFHVHGNPVEIVDSYKYLGVLFSSCTTLVGNPFKNNFQYLADNAGKAIHSIYSYSNILGRFPVRTSFALYDGLVKPIWVRNMGVIGSLDCVEKVQLRFIKTILGLKMSTSTVMCYGECGRFPMALSIFCKVIKY